MMTRASYRLTATRGKDEILRRSFDDRDQANQALVKQALEILPDCAIRELGDEDIAQWVVVRVNDDITIDLMTEACGVRYEDTAGGIETVGVGTDA